MPARELIEAAEAAGLHCFGHPDPEPISGPFGTAIWLARIASLKSHLRIIQNECAGSDDPHVQRLGRQALAGLAEADHFISEPDWDACSIEERTA